MVLSPQWRLALEILTDAGETGISRTALTARFSDEMVASLVLTGLATSVRDGALFTEIARLRITDKGQRALDVDANSDHRLHSGSAARRKNRDTMATSEPTKKGRG
jgi:hypothetical protein